jgi:hypothetical protein
MTINNYHNAMAQLEAIAATPEVVALCCELNSVICARARDRTIVLSALLTVLSEGLVTNLDGDMLDLTVKHIVAALPQMVEAMRAAARE